MNISDKSTYFNSIYAGIVVNSNKNQDPSGKNRYQIYIPEFHYELKDKYSSYINNTDKENDPNYNDFPWAVSLVDDLKENDTIYGSFIENDNSKFIILGKEKTGTNDSSFSGNMTLNGSGILDLTMPVILHNEISLPFDKWPDKIDDGYFQKILPNDNGAFSVGLIQWNGNRAFDILFKICHDFGDWKSCFTNKFSTFYFNMAKAIREGNIKNCGDYSRFILTLGSSEYNSVLNILKCQSSRKVQIQNSQEDTKRSIDNLMNDYNINNPAVIIFVADIMNQYGFYKDKLKNEASSICKDSSLSMMDQLDKVIEWCQHNLGQYYTYINRRQTTISYIKELYNQGKLNGTNLVDMSFSMTSPDKFLWPIPNWFVVTSPFGPRTLGGKNGFHRGVDLAGDRIRTPGQPIKAAKSGKVISAQYSGSYGNMVLIEHNAKYKTRYAHQQRILVNKGDIVKQGQVIGCVGNTRT